MTRKQKQGILPGTLSPRMRAIEAAAETYAQHRDERMEAGERELAVYRRGKFSVALDTKDSVKVKINEDEPAEPEEETSEEAAS